MLRIVLAAMTALALAGCASSAPSTAAQTAAPTAARTATVFPGSPSPRPSQVATISSTSTAALPSASLGRPPLADGDAWIAYQAITSQRSGAHGVTFIHPDGTGSFFALYMIPGGVQLHPDWSPDGRKILADVENPGHTPEIWMADLSDWSGRKVVDCSAPCLWVQEPAWSPDGTRIAYQRHMTSDAGELSQIEILDLASGSTDVVFKTGTDRGVYAPRWSPDGKSLVFEQTKTQGDSLSGVSLEVLDIAKPYVTRTIVSLDHFANNSDWSPDGNLIAFSAPLAGGEPGGALSDIWVVNPDGSNPRRITNVAASGGTAVQPTFTSDATQIMFKLTDVALKASNAMALVAVGGGDPQPATASGYLYGWHPRLRPVH